LNAKYTILIVIVAIAIIIGSVAAYTSMGANSVQPSPTPTPTVSPTASPTAVPTASPTTSPTVRPTAHPTTNPIANPTATPAPTPSPSPTPVPVPASLTGAGATFPYPLLNAMITNYTTAKPYIQVNYQSIGSGGGISAMQQKLLISEHQMHH
jgi:ABC-type phosphate transport system substrate-binding protein